MPKPQKCQSAAKHSIPNQPPRFGVYSLDQNLSARNEGTAFRCISNKNTIHLKLKARKADDDNGAVTSARQFDARVMHRLEHREAMP
jgi:hypothetical protein